MSDDTQTLRALVESPSEVEEWIERKDLLRMIIRAALDGSPELNDSEIQAFMLWIQNANYSQIALFIGADDMGNGEGRSHEWARQTVIKALAKINAKTGLNLRTVRAEERGIERDHVTPDWKWCGRCQRSLPATMFNRSTYTASGLRPYCRHCDAKLRKGTG